MRDGMRFSLDGRTVTVDDFTREVAIIETNGSISSPPALNDIGIRVKTPDEFLSCFHGPPILDNAYYNITRTCNLRCPYCYSTLSASFVSRHAHEVILQRLQQLKTHSVTLIGGEPFCHRDIDFLVSTICESPIAEVCIVTNGTLIKESHLNALSHQKVSVQVSLDGIDEEHNAATRGPGSFRKTMKAVAMLKEAGIPCRVMAVLSRHSAEWAVDFYEKFSDLGWDPGFFRIKQVDDADRPTLDQIKTLLDYVYERNGHDSDAAFDTVKFADNVKLNPSGFPKAHCGAGIMSISVEPNGDVYPCVKRVNPEERITNLLLDNSISELAHSRQRRLQEELVWDKPICSACKIRTICGGGCRADSPEGGVCDIVCSYYNFALEWYVTHL